LKIFSLLDTAINYLQNQYNNSRHLWNLVALPCET